jgi:hypothetical protein
MEPVPREKLSGIRHDGDGRETLASPHRRCESLDLSLIQKHVRLKVKAQFGNRHPLRSHYPTGPPPGCALSDSSTTSTARAPLAVCVASNSTGHPGRMIAFGSSERTSLMWKNRSTPRERMKPYPFASK